MKIADRLLEQALNSILHGSMQIISSIDQNGNQTRQEIRVGDLRQSLVSELAKELVKTEEFKKSLLSAFTQQVIEAMQKNAIDKITYSDLPYDVKTKVERQIQYLKVEVKKYKMVAETVTE